LVELHIGTGRRDHRTVDLAAAIQLLGTLADILIVGLLNLEQQTAEVFVTLDYLIEGLIESLQFLSLIIRGFFQPCGQLLLQIYGISGEVSLILCCGRLSELLAVCGRLLQLVGHCTI
jgi:hypothetical protein